MTSQSRPSGAPHAGHPRGTKLLSFLHHFLGHYPEEASIILELAIPLLDLAAGSHVRGLVGATDPYEAVREALEREPYDEVIVSTLPQRVSRWLHLDLAHRIAGLGVPVSVITAEQSEPSHKSR